MYTLDNSGNVQNIFKINDLADLNSDNLMTIDKYNIDTTENKIIMKRFIDLSRKFKFGHTKVDKLNRISFSYKDGLSEQFVMTFNDSVQDKYSKDKDFKLLKNGWFEYIER